MTTIIDMQEQMLMGAADMERLIELIDDASKLLWDRFLAIAAAMRQSGNDDLARDIERTLTTLQFHDMTGQIVSHNVTRMHLMADALGALLDADVAPEVSISPRASAVAQRAMQAGSVELF
ncbi:MAG: hypothetical protein R3E87_01405 [Burkholderiaceae bacterium]